MEQNREKRLELKRRDRRRRFWNIVTVAALFVLLVLMGVYVDRVTPIRTDGGVYDGPTSVSFTRSHLDWLDENYNEDLENGFCLFGEIDGNNVVVEEVEFVDNPLSQDKHSMRFTCVPQIAVRSSDLVKDEDYKFVGAIHTHSISLRLSRVDKNTFSKVEDVIKVFGVYNGEEVAMYDRPYGAPIETVLRLN